VGLAAKSNANLDADCDHGPHPILDAYAQRHCDLVTHRNNAADGNTLANGYSNPVADTNGHTLAHRYTGSDADANRHALADGYAIGDGHAFAHRHTVALAQ
jgi:hypothetical protein